MGVLNLTPDSFSDGGQLLSGDESPDLPKLVDRASEMLAAGADLLDLGGESTRPGATTLDPQREAGRVVPAIEALCKRFEAPISIDTRKASVAALALDAGAQVVNDVSGFRADPDLPRVAGRARAVVLGHLRGEPESMQEGIDFGDVLEEVTTELVQSWEIARAAGIPEAAICLDPGIGFGKTAEHNLRLVANADRLRERLPEASPMLFGVSRKGFLGALIDRPAAERDLASHVSGALALFLGASAVRAHDVRGASEMVRVVSALRRARGLS